RSAPAPGARPRGESRRTPDVRSGSRMARRRPAAASWAARARSRRRGCRSARGAGPARGPARRRAPAPAGPRGCGPRRSPIQRARSRIPRRAAARKRAPPGCARARGRASARGWTGGAPPASGFRRGSPRAGRGRPGDAAIRRRRGRVKWSLLIEKNWPFATTIRPGIMPAMSTVALRSTASPQAEAFVRAFAEMWARPTVEGFAALMHPEVRLVQPLARPARGSHEACEWFGGMLALVPDIRIAVDRWTGPSEGLCVAGTRTATFAGKRVGWSAVDRFRLADGKVLERIASFDPLPLLGAVVARPSGWLRFVRSRLGRRGRSNARVA